MRSLRPPKARLHLLVELCSSSPFVVVTISSVVNMSIRNITSSIEGRDVEHLFSVIIRSAEEGNVNGKH